jgi:hypothetical protein
MASDSAAGEVRFGSLPWLTLPGRFAHKRAQPGARHRQPVLTSSKSRVAAIPAVQGLDGV